MIAMKVQGRWNEWKKYVFYKRRSNSKQRWENPVWIDIIEDIPEGFFEQFLKRTDTSTEGETLSTSMLWSVCTEH